MVRSDGANIHDSVRIIHPELVNIYGAKIDAMTVIGPFVEIQSGVVIGQRCKISSHSFVCEGVTISDEVFIGHAVVFTNDLFPRATNESGLLQSPTDWELVETFVGKRASIGSNATIIGGVRIGENSIVGAGSVVTKDVDPGSIVAGNPARFIRSV